MSTQKCFWNAQPQGFLPEERASYRCAPRTDGTFENILANAGSLRRVRSAFCYDGPSFQRTPCQDTITVKFVMPHHLDWTHTRAKQPSLFIDTQRSRACETLRKEIICKTPLKTGPNAHTFTEQAGNVPRRRSTNQNHSKPVSNPPFEQDCK